MLPPASRKPGFFCHSHLFYHLRLEYVVPVIACRIQYDGMTFHCLLCYLYCLMMYLVPSRMCRSLAVLLVVILLQNNLNAS